MNKLDPKFKSAWVKALLSGNYKQVKHSLARFSDGVMSFCCLGVACVIAHAPMTIDANGRVVFNNDTSNGGYLPESIWPDNGFEDSKVTIRITSLHDRELLHKFNVYGDSHRISLASMNDNGVPFNIIAQMILRYL